MSLIKAMPDDRQLTILISTNTRQGMEILEKAAGQLAELKPQFRIKLTFFPFDHQSACDDTAGERIVARAIIRVTPT